MDLEEIISARDDWVHANIQSQQRYEQRMNLLRSAAPKIAGCLAGTLVVIGLAAGAIFGIGYAVDFAQRIEVSKVAPTNEPYDALPTMESEQEVIPTMEPNDQTDGLPPTSEGMHWSCLPRDHSYALLSIEDISEMDAPLNKLGGPMGVMEVDGVPFENGWEATTESYERQEYPQTLKLSARIDRPEQVYVYLQAGYGISRYNGMQIADIRLNFEQGDPIIHPLVQGENITDWTIGRNIVTVDIPDAYRNDTLRSVWIEDTTRDTAGSMDPAVHLLAVTVRYYDNECTGEVPRELVEELAGFGEASSTSTVEACLDNIHRYPFDGVIKNTYIPAHSVLASNVGASGGTWSDYPLRPLCYYDSWGLFETTDDLIAPYEGAIWRIE